jgi:hypothetical protein
VTSLTNGTTYTFTVAATNAVGTGTPSSASGSITPTAPAITIVQSVNITALTFNNAAGPITRNFTNNVTPGNTIVVGVTADTQVPGTAAQISAVSDGGSNSYTIDTATINSTGAIFLLSTQFAYITNCAGGFKNVTVTLSTFAYGGFVLLELAGVNSVKPSTAGTSGASTGTSVACTAITGVGAGSIAIAMAAQENSASNPAAPVISPGSGYTAMGNGAGGTSGWGMGEYETGVSGSVASGFSDTHGNSVRWCARELVLSP